MGILEPGQQLDHYSIVEEIGRGGMAVVYKATDQKTGRIVAIKVLVETGDPTEPERFRRELQTLSSLSHIHIVSVLDWIEGDKFLSIVMPFHERGTLKERLAAGPLPLAEVERYLSQIAEALTYAHSQGFIHRDLKPSNILLDTSGNVLLTDFGIAKLLGGSTQLTRNNSTIGSSAYMSPEQAQGQPVDQRSDVYSLGIVVYEMLTGRVPFQGPDYVSVLLQQVTGIVTPPTRYNPSIPAPIENLILRALSKRPDDRHPSVSALWQDWKQSVGQPKGLAATPAETETFAPIAAAPDVAAEVSVIARRYELLDYGPPSDLCESSFAHDLRANSNELVQVYTVNRSRASDLVHDFVERRARLLTDFSHPLFVPLIDFGYDSQANCYYFVYRHLGGIPLSKHVVEIRPGLSWSIRLLQGLSDGIAALHRQFLAHGSLEPLYVYLDTKDPQRLTCNIQQTGLAGLVNLLDKDEDAVQSAGFDELYAADVSGFFEVVGFVLVGKEERTEDDVRAVLRKLPDKLRVALLEVIQPESATEYGAFGSIRRSLERAGRLVEPETTYFLRAGDTATRQLHEYGFIVHARPYLAHTFLNQEFERGVHAWSEEGRDGTGKVYRLTTSQLRVWCVPDSSSVPARNLYIRGISIADQATLLLDREKGLLVRAPLVVGGNEAIPSKAEVATLLQEIENHVVQTDLTQRDEQDHKAFLGKWEELIASQLKELRSFALKYTKLTVVDQGTAVEVTLAAILQDTTLVAEDLLRLTDRDGQSSRAGYFEDISGNTMRIGLAAGVDPDNFKAEGVVTIDNTQVTTVLNRQRAALKRLRYQETVNANLPAILAEPELLTAGGQVKVARWHQDTLDESQRRAVSKVLAGNDLFMIQGPPGTGKTSTIAESVLQILERQEHARILVTSQSNVAVNNALDKIVELKPALVDRVVRVGREERAGSAALLMMDRQLQSWQGEVLKKSRDYMVELEGRLAGGNQLADILAMLSECEGYLASRTEKQEELVSIQAQLADSEADYHALEATVNRSIDLRKQAAGLSSQVSAGDERLQQLLRRFEDEYLAWVANSLADFERSVQLSAVRVDLANRIQLLQTEIRDLDATIETGEALIGDYLKTQYSETLTDLSSQRAFLRAQASTQSMETERFGRIKRIVGQWRQRIEAGFPGFSGAYLSRCRVIGATCIGVAAKGDVSELEFDWVIADEAGRATPPELLVPLVRGHRLVLVGDHRQLPPTIDQNLANALEITVGITRTDAETSLFQYLIGRVPEDLSVPLDTQYRMHPAIGNLIGNCFYEGKLKTGIDPEKRQHGLSWIPRSVLWYSTAKLPNHMEVQVGLSRRNQTEVDAIVRLLDDMNESYAQAGVSNVAVGVITGYLAQKAALRQRVGAMRNSWLQFREVEVDTVDAYQGRERDIVIYSVVRSNPRGRIGFLRDDRRLNVALSRARNLLIIVGDEEIEFADESKNPFHTVIRYIRTNTAECRLEPVKQ